MWMFNKYYTVSWQVGDHFTVKGGWGYNMEAHVIEKGVTSTIIRLRQYLDCIYPDAKGGFWNQGINISYDIDEEFLKE